MKTLRKGLLVVVVILLSLLAAENLLTAGLMMELGVPRAIWRAALESSVFLLLSILLIRRVRLWPRRP